MPAVESHLILLLLAGAAAIQATIVLLFARVMPRLYRGLELWRRAALVNVAALALFLLSGVMPTLVTVVGTFGGLVAAMVLFLAGINRFLERPRPFQEQVALAVLAATLVVLGLLAALAPALLLWRIVTVNLALGVVSAMCSWSLLRSAHPSLRTATLFTAAVFGGTAGWHLLRAAVAALSATAGAAEPAAFPALAPFVGICTLLLSAAGIVALAAQRMARDMRAAAEAARAAEAQAARDSSLHDQQTRTLLAELAEASRALNERELLLRGISDNLPNGLIYQLERLPDGTAYFRYISAGVERLWGLTPAEVYADAEALWSRIHPDDRALFDEAARKARESVGIFDMELRVLLPDGDERWTNSRSSAQLLADGRVLRNGIETDITARKLAESQLRRRIDELLALNQIAQALSAWTDLAAELRTVAPMIERLFGVAAVTIWEYDAPHGRLLPLLPADGRLAPLDLASTGLDLAAMARHELHNLELPAGHPLLRTGRNVALSEPGHTLMVHLRSRNAIVGLLCLHAAERARSLSADTAALAQTVAGLLASAVDNARLLTQAQAAGAERERRAIARELHDSVSQALYAANVAAETVPLIWELDPDEGRERLQELSGFTHTALAEMRALLVELRPRALVDTPLHETLRLLAAAVAARHAAKAAHTLAPAPLLPPEVQVALYRIAQEALNNAGKHAGAARLALTLEVCPPFEVVAEWTGTVAVTVSDDGRGFDPHLSPAGRMGLGTMRERAAEIGATIVVNSRPGAGTTVRISWSGTARPPEGEAPATPAETTAPLAPAAV